MKLKIDKNLYVKTDDRCYIVYKIYDKMEYNLYYYTTLESLLNGILEQKLLNTKNKNYKEILKDIEKIKLELKEIKKEIKSFCKEFDWKI